MAYRVQEFHEMPFLMLNKQRGEHGTPKHFFLCLISSILELSCAGFKNSVIHVNYSVLSPICLGLIYIWG